MALTLAAIHRFPVKSCAGATIDTAEVEPWGLAGDRRWMVTDPSGSFLTARELPRMLLIGTEVTDGGLRLTAPGRAPLEVAVPLADESRRSAVQVWSSSVRAARADSAADVWLSEYLGRDARLVYLDDPSQRRTDSDYGSPDDVVSFADGYPLLVASQPSLDALNDWIAEGPRFEQGPLPMTRFRPNLVVTGGTAWDEDGWRRLRIGDAEFRAVKGCSRCAITMTDPVTAQRDSEPIATLARYRRWDGATWFGMNLVPDTPGSRIRVGDPVEIVERVDAPDGPPR